MPTEQERLATLEAKTDQHDKTLETLAGDVKDIKDNLLKRPSWAVSIVITVLTTICVGLSVYVITTLQATTNKSISSIIRTL